MHGEIELNEKTYKSTSAVPNGTVSLSFNKKSKGIMTIVWNPYINGIV